MNLKESFRYQNFLGSLLSSAASSLTDVQHCLTTTKTHLRNKANEDAEDVTEQVDIGEFHKNDDVLRFMLYLIDEREKLTTAIGRAKASIGFDLDAAVETNKFRQTVVRNINMMLRYKVSKRTERGTDYKFNAEGNQTPYYYDIEVVTSENFDRAQAKAAVRPGRRVSFAAVLGFAFVGALMVATLLCYVRINSISRSIVSMKERISVLQVEQVALLTQYEQTFDLSAVKEAAMAAGMHQPSESQIIYISLPGEDQVTAYQAKPSLFEGFSLDLDIPSLLE